jgi:fluoride exporter
VTPVLFIAAAGAGAALRHLVNQAGLRWVGTLVINIVGAFALGLLVAVEPSANAATVLGTGLVGSFTTFSTFALEATESDDRQRVMIIGATLVLGLAAAAAGFALG